MQQQRATTRIIVVHTGHPSEQPMTPAELLDLGADTYLAPAVAARARRAREGADPLVGRLPTATRAGARAG